MCLSRTMDAADHAHVGQHVPKNGGVVYPRTDEWPERHSTRDHLLATSDLLNVDRTKCKPGRVGALGHCVPIVQIWV